MAIEDQLREIRTTISQVQGKKARAQVELDNANERLETARTTLKEDFGVETTDEARTKLTDLQAELESVVAEVERALEESGA